jgi:hypothetical protein
LSEEVRKVLDGLEKRLNDGFQGLREKYLGSTEKTTAEGPSVQVERDQDGKIKSIDVVVLEEPAVSCRPYEFDPASGIDLCFNSKGRLAKMRYAPSKFAEVAKADLSRIQQRLESCPLCKPGEEKK